VPELALELPCPGAEELDEVGVGALADGSVEAGVVALAGVLGVLAAGVAGWDVLPDGLELLGVLLAGAELAGGVD
jgi:hypothetical protein